MHLNLKVSCVPDVPDIQILIKSFASIYISISISISIYYISYIKYIMIHHDMLISYFLMVAAPFGAALTATSASPGHGKNLTFGAINDSLDGMGKVKTWVFFFFYVMLLVVFHRYCYWWWWWWWWWRWRWLWPIDRLTDSLISLFFFIAPKKKKSPQVWHWKSFCGCPALYRFIPRDWREHLRHPPIDVHVAWCDCDAVGRSFAYFIHFSMRKKIWKKPRRDLALFDEPEIIDERLRDEADRLASNFLRKWEFLRMQLLTPVHSALRLLMSFGTPGILKSGVAGVADRLWRMAFRHYHFHDLKKAPWSPQMSSGWWLGHPSEKNESQLGWLFSMGKSNSWQPNHQPVMDFLDFLPCSTRRSAPALPPVLGSDPEVHLPWALEE